MLLGVIVHWLHPKLFSDSQTWSHIEYLVSFCCFIVLKNTNFSENYRKDVNFTEKTGASAQPENKNFYL